MEGCGQGHGDLGMPEVGALFFHRNSDNCIPSCEM